MDILIITVGTRQIGWKCKDGIVRCFGVDGNQNYPPHIDELYAELNLERGSHEPSINWGVRHLGEVYYQHCQKDLGGDFSAVQLLMDDKIIRDLASEGLQTIMLWSTNQPDNVPWKYRALDTLWLAKLMEQKIKSDFPELKVDVVDNCLNIMETKTVYEELQHMILPLALEKTTSNQDNNASLKVAIQTKGCAPAIANVVDIFSGTLVRQFEVFKITPEEPEDNYKDRNREAKFSQKTDRISISEYFWQLEKTRIKSLWQRGDFSEAKIWLESHQSEYKALYQLAGYLSLARNGEITRFLNNPNLKNWFRANATQQLVGDSLVQKWKQMVNDVQNESIREAWEGTFLIRINLLSNYYTNAFFQFMQLIERLLFIRFQEEQWLEKKWIEIPPDKQHWGSDFKPSFEALINGFSKSLTQNEDPRKRVSILHELRKFRNDVVHKGQPVSNEDLKRIWKSQNLDFAPNSSASIYNKFIEVLKWTVADKESIPQETFLDSLYIWGLQVLT